MKTIVKKITGIMGITEVRDNLSDTVDYVEKTNKPVTITSNNRPRAVVMNFEEYESWRETLDIMSRPELVKGIEAGIKDIKKGRYSTFEEVFGQSLSDAVAEEAKGRYGKSKKTSKK
ncbi:type II toxin-antitoxin system Phd/YefM family antitoxin [Patescibacteria group bacterium]|nr:type II toxin-antitoxin system Phd/YefM family antitoxin [Patescibacteria group bacterium]